MSIDSHYRRYLELTGSPEAAATLVLAAVESRQVVVMTPPQVAEALGVAHETVLHWIKTGFLKASNLATGQRPSYRVRPEDLQAFLDLRAA